MAWHETRRVEKGKKNIHIVGEIDILINAIPFPIAHTPYCGWSK